MIGASSTGRARQERRRRLVPLLLAASLVAGCAPKRLVLPTDAGAPLSDYQAVHAMLTSGCDVRSFTAELSLSGRAGDTSLRGRVLAGFERPDAMRLEGVAPIGAPGFILTARAGSAVLLLPRDARVLRDAAPREVLGALTGVALGPADLQAILTGCVAPGVTAVAGRVHGNGWASIDLAGGAVLYLAPVRGGWQLRAARRDGWQIEYTPSPSGSGFPAVVRLRADGPPAVDLRAEVGQVEANVDLDPRAFTVEVPPGTEPIWLDDLREAGPLRGQ